MKLYLTDRVARIDSEVMAPGYMDIMWPVKGCDISLCVQGVAALSAFSGQPIFHL